MRPTDVRFAPEAHDVVELIDLLRESGMVTISPEFYAGETTASNLRAQVPASIEELVQRELNSESFVRFVRTHTDEFRRSMQIDDGVGDVLPLVRNALEEHYKEMISAGEEVFPRIVQRDCLDTYVQRLVHMMRCFHVIAESGLHCSLTDATKDLSGALKKRSASSKCDLEKLMTFCVTVVTNQPLSVTAEPEWDTFSVTNCSDRGDKIEASWTALSEKLEIQRHPPLIDGGAWSAHLLIGGAVDAFSAPVNACMYPWGQAGESDRLRVHFDESKQPQNGVAPLGMLVDSKQRERLNERVPHLVPDPEACPPGTVVWTAQPECFSPDILHHTPTGRLPTLDKTRVGKSTRAEQRLPVDCTTFYIDYLLNDEDLMRQVCRAVYDRETGTHARRLFGQSADVRPADDPTEDSHLYLRRKLIAAGVPLSSRQTADEYTFPSDVISFDEWNEAHKEAVSKYMTSRGKTILKPFRSDMGFVEALSRTLYFYRPDTEKAAGSREMRIVRASLDHGNGAIVSEESLSTKVAAAPAEAAAAPEAEVSAEGFLESVNASEALRIDPESERTLENAMDEMIAEGEGAC